MTPLLWPVWWRASGGSLSILVREMSGKRLVSRRPVASPATPPPIIAIEGFDIEICNCDGSHCCIRGKGGYSEAARSITLAERPLASRIDAGEGLFVFFNHSAAICSAWSICSIVIDFPTLLLVRDICWLAIKYHLYASIRSLESDLRVQ